MEQQAHRACERTKSKQKQSQSRHVSLTARSIIRISPQILQYYNGIMKG